MKKLLLLFLVLLASCRGSNESSTNQQSTRSPPPTAEVRDIALAVFVDDDGDDSRDGSINAPFKTLERARDHLRDYRIENVGLPVGDVIVYIREGDYPVRKSFSLTAEDSGTEDSPISYTAYRDEKVTFSGGVTLTGKDLETVTDPAVLDRLDAAARHRVRKLDLSKVGITMAEFGEIQYWQTGGLRYPVGQSVIFMDDQRLTLARYPKENGGPKGDGFVLTGSVIHTGSIPRYGKTQDPVGGVFKFTDEEVANWSSYDNVWLYGYMKETYADGTLKIKAVNRTAGTIEVEQPSWYGIGEGGRYSYQNVLEQLTLEGESVIDSAKGVIYLIPTAGFKPESTIELSIGSEPLIHIEGADFVTLAGMACKLTRNDAIQVKGASHVALENLSIRNVEGNGIVMPEENEFQNTIGDVRIANIGGYPFRIGGGNLLTQKPGDSLVSNCSFTHFGLNRSGRSRLTGVGNVVKNCEFSHSKDGALGIGGNDLTVEYCTFKFLNQEGSDAGAVYMGRNPAEAGIRIRSNYFQDIGNEQAKVTGIQGVYVDDRSGFVEVSGNIFNRVGSGVHAAAFKVNGGKHNRFSGNLVVGGRAAYLQVHDTAGKAWAEWYATREIADKLAKVDATNPDSPWSRRYPVARSAIEDVQQPPTTTNVLENNIILNGELVYGIIVGRYGDPLPTKSNNHEIDQDPGFRDLAKDDFHITKEVWQREFAEIEWIDFERIGLLPKTLQ